MAGIPLWIKLWLLVSLPVVVWDATFILFRPQSLPGGELHHIWQPCPSLFSPTAIPTLTLTLPV